MCYLWYTLQWFIGIVSCWSWWQSTWFYFASLCEKNFGRSRLYAKRSVRATTIIMPFPMLRLWGWWELQMHKQSWGLAEFRVGSECSDEQPFIHKFMLFVLEDCLLTILYAMRWLTNRYIQLREYVLYCQWHSLWWQLCTSWWRRSAGIVCQSRFERVTLDSHE